MVRNQFGYSSQITILISRNYTILLERDDEATIAKLFPTMWKTGDGHAYVINSSIRDTTQ